MKQLMSLVGHSKLIFGHLPKSSWSRVKSRARCVINVRNGSRSSTQSEHCLRAVQICSLMGGSRWTLGVVLKGPFQCHALCSLCCPFCSCVGVLALSSKGNQNEKWQQVVKATWELHTCVYAGDVCVALLDWSWGTFHNFSGSKRVFFIHLQLYSNAGMQHLKTSSVGLNLWPWIVLTNMSFVFRLPSPL